MGEPPVIKAEYLNDIIDDANEKRSMYRGLESLPKPEPILPAKPRTPRKPSQHKKQAVIKDSIKPISEDSIKEDK